MIKLLGARVLLKEDTKEETTASGIVLPEKAQEKTYRGTVLAVGPGVVDDNNNLHPVQVAIGDKVIFAKFAGTVVKVDDEEYIVINERDILAITEE